MNNYSELETEFLFNISKFRSKRNSKLIKPQAFFLIVIVQMQRIIYKRQIKRQRQILLTNQSSFLVKESS